MYVKCMLQLVFKASIMISIWTLYNLAIKIFISCIHHKQLRLYDLNLSSLGHIYARSKV